MDNFVFDKKNFSYVFWVGDLNFRLEENDTDTPELIVERVKRAEKNDYSELLDCDQLRSVMRNEKAFSELNERKPRFPPTYKYVIGTNEYDYKLVFFIKIWMFKQLYKTTC